MVQFGGKEIKAIDVWFNLLSAEVRKHLFDEPEVAAAKQVEKLDRGQQVESILPDDYVKTMDAAGVEMTLLVTMQQGFSFRMYPGKPAPRQVLSVSYKEVLPYVEKYPKRFRGLYGVNPWLMMDAVRELEMVVKKHGFVGAVTHTGGFAPFNDKIWFPFYSKCCELDVPVITQSGHFAEAMNESYCLPSQIDEVAMIFPELRIVAGHTGWPFGEQFIGVALKNQNVYISMEAHLPKYWEPSMVTYLQTRGAAKCMWGSDWPVTNAKQNLEQVAQMGIKDKVLPYFLRENAVKVFKLGI